MSQNRILAALNRAAHFGSMNGGRVQSLSGALVALAVSLPLTATTVPYKSFEDLVKEADAVVSGRVAEVESKYGPHKEIFTFVTLDQVETLAGSNPGSRLTLRFLGGKIDNDISQVVGSPTFDVNDRVVLFVQGNGRFMVPLVGWSQGVFRIGEDAATGELSVRDNEGNRVFGIQGGRLIKETAAQPEARIIGEMKAQPFEPADKGASAGLADYGTSAQVAGPTQNATEKSAPATAGAVMTYERFKDAVGNAASGRKGWGRLESVSRTDFSRPGKGADAALDTKPAAGPAVEQGPTLPKPTPITPRDDER